jgi:hypothetical protein
VKLQTVAGVLKVCVFVIANISQQIAMSLIWACYGMFSCAPEMLCFTMHVHEFVNAFVKIMMWTLDRVCVCVCFYFGIYNDLKHFRLTAVSIEIFHDGTMYCILG